MLSNISDEIFSNIFLQLHQDDQHECMLVCRRWNQIITRFVLYRTVFIYSPVSMKNLVEKLKEKPGIIKRIEKVLIHIDPKEKKKKKDEDEGVHDDDDDDDDDDKEEVKDEVKDDNKEEIKEENKEVKKEVIKDKTCGELLSLLDNLKVLHCSSDDFSEYCQQQYSWCDQIEYISGEAFCPMESLLLLSNSYPNLKTLKDNGNISSPLPILSNATTLTTLNLNRLRINFDDFELMHDHLPHLRSFKIREFICLGDFRSDKAMFPANAMIDFGTSVCNEGCLKLLMYIIKKYPNLSNLTYNASYHSYTSEERKVMNEIGWTLLFPKLGSQLKRLCVDYSNHVDNLFENLDRSTCEINYLRLGRFDFRKMATLVQSQQVLHIQTLVINDIKFGSFSWLKHLVVLKKLKLIYKPFNCSYGTVRMQNILRSAPTTLESLSIRGVNLTTDLATNCISNIRTLSCEDVRLDSKVDVVLSRCFPRLTKLKLKYCGLRRKKLNLANMNIMAFHYAEKGCRYGNDRSVSIITLKNNERRYYHMVDHASKPIPKSWIAAVQPQNYLNYKSVPSNEMNFMLSSVILICNSFGKLVLE